MVKARKPVALPPGVAALGDDVEERVLGMVEAARAQQAAELRRALDDTLRIVPRPLRGLVRKVVGA